MNAFGKFDEKIESLARQRRAKIAFGLLTPDRAILQSLERSKEYADIVLVGSAAIKDIAGFEVITGETPEEKLAEILTAGAVGGIVRGTVDDFKTRDAYKRRTGEEVSSEISLMQDTAGRRFFFGPASNPDGWEKEERLKIAEEFVAFCREWEITPRVAVLTGVRHDTYTRKKEMRGGIVGVLNKSYEDAEWIVAELTKSGIEAKNWAIDSDLAIKDGFNIVIAPNGMVGNQMFRMLLLSEGKILFCTHMGNSHPYEDNSRNEKDFDYHIKWLTALINRKSQRRRHGGS